MKNTFGGLPSFISDLYGSAVAYIDVELPNGDRSIGAGFHVGEGIFVTARHVVEGVKILEFATTVDGLVNDSNGNFRVGGLSGESQTYRSTRATTGRVVSGPHFHPNPDVDVALLRIEGIDAPALHLGSHIADEWISDNLFVLQKVLVMGYPPIPFNGRAVLFMATAEINAVVRKYTGGNIHFAVSTMARGGYSGGPCLDKDGRILGMVVEALGKDEEATQLGFMAAVSIEPIIDCLLHHGLLPANQNVDPEENWD
jgi:S1-C subfamily serine protease